jgi:hypothetical protein
MIKLFNYEYLILNVNTPFLYITAFHTTKKPVYQYVNTGQFRNASRPMQVKVNSQIPDDGLMSRNVS